MSKTKNLPELTAQMARNRARLGTRWQENPTPDLRMPWEEKKDLWRAKDAYEMAPFVWAIAGLVLCFLIGFLSSCTSYTHSVARVMGAKTVSADGTCERANVLAHTCVPVKGVRP